MITKKLLLTAAANLEKRAKNLKNFDEKKIEKMCLEYTFEQIQNDLINIEQLKKYKNKPTIYVFRTTEDKSKEIYVSYNVVVKKNKRYKKEDNNHISYSQDNSDKYSTSKTVLYVGKSCTDIKRRLTQHLTEQYKGIFSLHLAGWDLKNLFNDKLFIDIYIFHKDDDTEHTKDNGDDSKHSKDNDNDKKQSEEIINLTQDIEDAMWEEFKPMFGKKGKNPREN